MSIIDTLKAALTNTVQQVEQLSAEKIAEFKMMVGNWLRDVNSLEQANFKDPALAEKQNELLKSASFIKKSILAIPGVATVLGIDDKSLSVVPLIAGAAIIAVLAAISKWSDQYVQFRKIAEANSLIEQGVNPSEAFNLINSTEKKGLFDNIKGIAIGGGLLALTLFLANFAKTKRLLT